MRDDLQGWRPIFRQIKDWCWYKDLVTKAVFIHILLSVNTTDKNWKGITIKKGQMLTSRSHLAEEVGISEQQARRALSNLQSTGEITCESTNRYTLITLVNDSVFAITREKSNQQINQQSNQVFNQLPTSKQPASNQQPTTTKNNKSINNNNNINNINKYINNNNNVRAREKIPEELKDDMEKYMLILYEHGGEISTKTYQRSVRILAALGDNNVESMRQILQNAIRDNDKYLRPL